jgi:hypothetical protein
MRTATQCKSCARVRYCARRCARAVRTRRRERGRRPSRPPRLPSCAARPSRQRSRRRRAASLAQGGARADVRSGRACDLARWTRPAPLPRAPAPSRSPARAARPRPRRRAALACGLACAAERGARRSAHVGVPRRASERPLRGCRLDDGRAGVSPPRGPPLPRARLRRRRPGRQTPRRLRWRANPRRRRSRSRRAPRSQASRDPPRRPSSRRAGALLSRSLSPLKQQRRRWPAQVPMPENSSSSTTPAAPLCGLAVALRRQPLRCSRLLRACCCCRRLPHQLRCRSGSFCSHSYH